MKRIIALAAVIIAVLIFASYCQPKIIGFLDNDVFAITGNALSRNLLKEEVLPKKATIEPKEFKALEPLYQLGKSLYVGEKRSKLNIVYPLFVNDSSALLNLNDQAKLVTPDFRCMSTYYGLYVSDGVSYNTDGERADVEEFILQQLQNKMYINTKVMQVHTIRGNFQVAMNGIINFLKDSIRYYALEDGKFYYHQIKYMDEQARVTFGDWEYPYYEFLDKIAKINKDPTFSGELKVPQQAQDQIEELERPEIEQPETEKDKQKEKEKEGAEPTPPKKPQASGSKASAYYKPQVSMSDFFVDFDERVAQTELTINDPSGALFGEIQVCLFAGDADLDEGEVLDIWVTTDYDLAKDNVIYQVARFMELERDKEYIASGKFTYLNKEGEEQWETFGPMSFIVSEEISSEFTEWDVFVKPEDKEKTNKKPVISCTPFSASVYELKSTLTIEEYGSLIGRTVRFEVYREKQLYMRKALNESGEIKIGLLPPGTEYKVIGFYEYLNQYNLKEKEIIIEQTVSTLSLDILAPLKLTFENGEIFHDKIQLKNVSFADDPTDNAKKVGQTTLPYVAKIIMRVNNDYSFWPTQITEMRAGEKIVYETPAVLKSNKKYDYTLLCYDRFGNELSMTESAEGQAHTCKTPPLASIRVEKNEVANIVLSVLIDNNDSVEMENCRISIINAEGNLIPTIIKTEAGGESSAKTQHVIPKKGGKIAFINLPAGEVFSACVFCDYDLDNEKGMQRNVEIGKIHFTALSIPALGYAIFDMEMEELTENEALLNIALNKNRTSESLLFLLSKVRVVITDPDNKEIYSISYTGKELQRLKDGETLSIQLEDLMSTTEYKIELKAEVEQGSVIYDIKTANKFNVFKTLKQEPEVDIPSYFTVSNSIELYNVRINDPHGAILSTVNLLVSDSFGRLVGTSVLNANTTYEKLSFPKLVENETYTFTFIAIEYNQGYDYTTYQSLYQLQPVYEIKNENKLAGKIILQGLDEVAGDDQHFQAKLRVQINDEQGLLSDEPQYIIKVYKDGEEVDTFRREIDSVSSDFDSIIYYLVDKFYEYRLELWVQIHEHEFKLSETIPFTTEQRIIGLSTINDFSQLGKYPTGKFIVLNDIELTAGPWSFNGELDFQGHTLTSNKSRYLFSTLGKNAIIKNMVLDLTVPDAEPFRYRGFIAYTTYGHMQNIVVNLKGCTELLHNDWGLICRSTGTTSIIENFVINLESSPYVWKNFGCVAAYNSGTIRNGYIYGADIILPDIDVEGGYTGDYFSTVVGNNQTAGRIENVYSLVNIRTGSIVTPTKNRFGTIAGLNSGIVKGAFTNGEVYFAGSPDLRYGPAVGSESGKKQTSAYYISETSTYTNTYNTKATKETLYDPLWHHAVLGEAFVIDETVPLGYYPQLKMPACMPAQPFLPLPELDVTNAVDLASVMVEEQHEDYAIAVFTFQNPNAYNIKRVAVEYLDATVIEGSQVDKDGLSRVRVCLDNPTNFYSSYNVMYIGYSVTASSAVIIRNYQKGERIVNAEFFKPIYTIEDWTAIQDKLDQNHRLKEDLNFNNVPSSSIRIGKTESYRFTGKLDGGIYDENGNLTGLHTIKNIDMTGGLGGVITYLGGSVSNMRVENLIIENPTDSYVGFVRRTLSGAVIYNVHLDNVRAQGKSLIGGIVGYCYYASLQNCSVNDLVLKDADLTVTAGGIAGQVTYSIFENCYCYGLEINIERAQTGEGIGGIIGYTTNSEVRNCYAVGSIQTTIQNAGGLIGKATSGNIVENMWSDVDIITNVDYIGGMVGLYSGDISSIVPVNTLVLGDLYSSNTTANNVRRIFGNRTDMENGYAWNGQCKNGEIPYEEAADGTSILVKDGAEILDNEELRSDQTYIKFIQMGEYFDYSKVGAGILPQLYSTDGELLPYQTDHKFDEKPLIEVIDVTANTVGSDYIIQISLSHEPGVEIEDVIFDYLNVETEVYPDGQTKTVLQCTLDGQPLRFLDSYKINGIKYNNGKVYNVLARVSFETPFYYDIPDVATWQSVMAERGNNYENFRITDDLDFANRADIVYDVNVNRLVGSVGEDGEYTTISNINIDFPATGQAFINSVNAGVKNLRFENITLTNKKTGGSSMGVIGKCLGNVENVDFYNITINGLSASQVGCIGYAAGGMITNINTEAITVITTADYAGGLIGRMENNGMLNMVEAKEIEVSGRDQIGGIAGRVVGDISYSSAEEVTVTGTRNYTGGIAGLVSTPFNMNDIKNQALTIKKSYIRGVSCVGGCFGHGAQRNDTKLGNWNRVEDTTIIGTGNYVGGTMGTAQMSGNLNIVVSNCKIFGNCYVGGMMPTSAGLSMAFVLDSVISTIFDPKYGIETGLPVPTPTSSQNRYIGGIIPQIPSGAGVPSYCGVVNCSIGAEGADYVGGFVGHWGYRGSYYFCLDSTVYGRNYIGGIAGYHSMGPISYCYSNADVIASGENAGGLAGYMQINHELLGTNAAHLLRNYYVGNVSASDYAGGLVGRTNAPLYGTNAYLVVAANVTTEGEHGNIIGNLADGSFTYLRIYEQSVLKRGVSPEETAADIYVDEPQSDAGMRLVTSADLKEKTTYNGFSGTYYNFDSLTHNFMPYLKYSGNTMPYQEGKDAEGNYNPINSYLGGIPIPSGTVGAQSNPIMSLAFEPQELPIPEFYAVDVDKLNIEFNTANEYTGFIVSANGVNLYEPQITKQVYTLSYDFSTPLTVTVTDGFHEQEYTVKPAELRRDVLTWENDYYWITNLGVQSAKCGLLAGKFLHLYNGKGLTASGKVCDLTDGKVIKESVAIEFCEETQPLYSFNYDQYKIRTYKNYSESISDGETVNRELQLLVKNGKLAALDPQLPIVYDSVIVDFAGDKEYLTVLGTDGKIVDLKEHICLPQDFKNSGIAQISNNLRSMAPYVLVRYKNGSVVAFNYLTGETLSVEMVKSDLSLFEYAKDFVQTKMDSVMSDLSDGYLEIAELKEKLTIHSYSGALDQTGEKGLTDTSAIDEVGLVEKEESNGIGVDEIGLEQTNVEDVEQGGVASDGEVSNSFVEQNQGDDVLFEEGEAVNLGEVKGKENDLAKPEQLVHNFIPVYDVKTGEYLLYDEKNLLEATDEQLIPLNELLDNETKLLKVREDSDNRESFASLSVNKGILYLALITLSILLLLGYIFTKRKYI